MSLEYRCTTQTSPINLRERGKKKKWGKFTWCTYILMTCFVKYVLAAEFVALVSLKSPVGNFTETS